jgi:hypothetical protein
MRTFLFAAAAVSSIAVACHVGGETNGAQHNAEFSYSNCFLGCATTTPMMLGDEEDVSVSGSSLPANVTLETSAVSVVSLGSAVRQCCTSSADAGTTCHDVGLNDACSAGDTQTLRITVDAVAVGSSDLVIKKPDGSVWDSVTLSVEKAASLDLACKTSPDVTLAVNGSCPITWVAKDAGGRGLMSTSGIHLTSSDKAVVEFNGFLSPAQGDIQATPQLFGDVTMVAIGAGDATVTGTGGGASETLSVHVTP